ncbi:MAG: glycosyltransferase [Methanobacteriaceae archaeon]|jgi:glycosyltransferase involved in cell wall biosynthesis|nr:glycosyltransferase [Methanobacteriaceae archaeon]MDO9627248.1 glycosyltransferase [Methanobacteriaceae archaeon]
MNAAKISIIIPVYNVEKYLEQCLESVINQTMTEIEIICVNDGSKDKSPQILEEFAQKDERIKVIHKENGGIASARNEGLKYVTGEYIGFVDSDDWIEPHMYETLYNNAKSNDCDMVMCSAHRFDEVTQELLYDLPYFTLEFFNESFNDVVFNYQATGNFLFKINVTPWNKVYKASFLKENKIKFPEGLDFEDNTFFYESYLKANKVSLVRDHLYFYRINRRGSFIATGNKRFFDVIPIQNLNEKLVREYCPVSLDSFLNFKIEQFISRCNQVDEEYKQEFLEIIKEDLSKTDIDDFKKLNETNQVIFNNLMKSNTYKEYELYEKISEMQKEIKAELHHQSKEYELKIKQQRLTFDEELKIKNRLIEEIMSSNSWKITGPLRNVRILFKKA